MTKLVELLKYILLGILQGITEVLPISSSGHLIIVSSLFGIKEESITFEVFLHLASLIAILFFLRKKIKQLVVGCYLYLFKKDKNSKNEFLYLIKIIVATIPLVIFTIIVKMLGYKTSNVLMVGICLIINAILLFVLTRDSLKNSKKNITIKDALIIGAFQMIGLFPGISRSGSALCGCFNRKISKEEATEFAFMMFIPSSIGALVLEFNNLKGIISLPPSILSCYLIAFFLAMITTYISFQFLSKVIRNNKLSIFSIYCILIGIIAIFYSLFTN